MTTRRISLFRGNSARLGRLPCDPLSHPEVVFTAHPLIRGGHAQTVAGLFWPSDVPPYSAVAHRVQLDDGDHIVLHEDGPGNWSPGDQVALLLHGLAGCHGSGYMRRTAAKLCARGVRVFRMDMRGVGAAAGLARLPAHAGRTEDASAALEKLSQLCPHSPVTLIGFSLGANITLGTLAEAARRPIGNLTRGIAVSPPADLSICCRELRKGLKRSYDAYLIRLLLKAWAKTGGVMPNRLPRSIYEFDERITAPQSGYRDAEDYYAQCSSGPRWSQINLPTRILAARDDPMVPISSIEGFPRSASVELFVTDSGGHLGYLSPRGLVSDRRWLDQRIVEWVCDTSW